jgi:hypothetical protein
MGGHEDSTTEWSQARFLDETSDPLLKKSGEKRTGREVESQQLSERIYRNGPSRGSVPIRCDSLQCP